MSFQDSQNLVSGNTLHLRDTVRVTKNHTNLRRSQTLLRKLANGLINLLMHHNKNVITNFISYLRLLVLKLGSLLVNNLNTSCPKTTINHILTVAMYEMKT